MLQSSFQFPMQRYWLSGSNLKGFSGAPGIRKLAGIPGKTQGRSALPGSTGMAGMSWARKPSRCHGRCKRKSSDLKTFSFVPASSTSRQGTLSPKTVLPSLASGAVSHQLTELFTSLKLLCQPVFYQTKHGVPDSSTLYSVICFTSSRLPSSLPLHSCKVKLIHLDLKKSDPQSMTPFFCLCLLKYPSCYIQE